MWENVLIALAFGFITILIAVPLLAIFGMSLIDVLARKDIGVSKFVWVMVVMAIPLGGLLLYWLFRPKDFDPWVETERETLLMGYSQPALATAGVAAAPSPRMTPAPRMIPAMQGGADPEPVDEAEQEPG